jgi:hypothetical protein
MKKLIFILMLLFANINLAQEFNGYKYFVVNELDYGSKGKDIYGISNRISSYLSKINNNIIKGTNDPLMPSELKYNNCLGLNVNISHKNWEIIVDFRNCKNERVKLILGEGKNSFDKALYDILIKIDEIKSYTFNEKLTPKIIYPEVENLNKNENDLKVYYDSSNLDPIEGIYKTYKSDAHYKVGIIKVGEFYKAIIIESDFPQWKKGDVKIIFESTAADGIFSTKYFNADKTSTETFTNLEGGLIIVELSSSSGDNQDIKFLKLYPKK